MIIIAILFILGILFLLGIASFCAWLFFAYRSYKRGTLKRFFIRTGIATVILIILACVGFFLLGVFFDARRMKQITGKRFHPGSPISQFHSSRSFTGDGYSIEIYTLPETVVAYFGNPDKDFRNYPCLPCWSPEDCCVVKWKTGIPDTEEQEFVDHALLSPQTYLYSFLRDKKISELLRTAETSLYKDTTHYSYFYRVTGDYVADIYFFIIVPVGKLLIIIDHTT